MSVPAYKVQVTDEREAGASDVLVRAVANGSRINDGKPFAGFLVRRRFHGDEFSIKSAKEFSANWMEFVEQPPGDWLPVIAKRYPNFTVAAQGTPAQREVDQKFAMSEIGSKKILSNDFDYSNGQPRRGPGRPRKQLVGSA